jgi:hypothetical protein
MVNRQLTRIADLDPGSAALGSKETVGRDALTRVD